MFSHKIILKFYGPPVTLLHLETTNSRGHWSSGYADHFLKVNSCFKHNEILLLISRTLNGYLWQRINIIHLQKISYLTIYSPTGEPTLSLIRGDNWRLTKPLQSSLAHTLLNQVCTTAKWAILVKSLGSKKIQQCFYVF